MFTRGVKPTTSPPLAVRGAKADICQVVTGCLGSQRDSRNQHVDRNSHQVGDIAAEQLADRRTAESDVAADVEDQTGIFGCSCNTHASTPLRR